MQKPLIILSLVIVALTGSGCENSGQGRGVEVPNSQLKRATKDSVVFESPLTHQEISQFIRVVQNLPDQKIPTFDKAELSFELNEGESIESYITDLRQSLKKALNPENQAESWSQQKGLARAFDQSGVTSRDFATLATKISLAWSATSIRGELPILRTQRKLNEKLQVAKSEFDSQRSTPENQKSKLQSIQELVALNEFLDLVQAIPDESLTAIQENSDRLESILPQVDFAAQFASFLNENGEVTQTEYSVH